jgi:hypothetical protein
VNTFGCSYFLSLIVCATDHVPRHSHESRASGQYRKSGTSVHVFINHGYFLASLCKLVSHLVPMSLLRDLSLTCPVLRQREVDVHSSAVCCRFTHEDSTAPFCALRQQVCNVGWIHDTMDSAELRTWSSESDAWGSGIFVPEYCILCSIHPDSDLATGTIV